MSSPIVALITDFGTSDHYVGVMKGVILTHCPEARLVDLTHGIAPQSIAHGSFCLAQSVDHFPQNTIFLCVVDPGVGSSRQAIAVSAGGHYFVAPDNGLLSMTLEKLDGAQEARCLSVPQNASGTFHGRDVFAPACGQLAAGTEFVELGPLLEELVVLGREPASLHGSKLEASPLFSDHFGNICLDFQRASDTFFTPGSHYSINSRLVPFVHTFSEVEIGESLLLWNSSNFLELAVRNGNAAQHWKLSPKSRLVIEKV